MATCKGCGTYVTKRFVRVFGSNDGNVYGCINCQPKATTDPRHKP